MLTSANCLRLPGGGLCPISGAALQPDGPRRLQAPVVLTILCLLQIFFQVKYFLPDPIENDVKYQASAQPFLVFGLLTTALAVGSTNAV
jgi:hypothetical protein